MNLNLWVIMTIILATASIFTGVVLMSSHRTNPSVASTPSSSVRISQPINTQSVRDISVTPGYASDANRVDGSGASTHQDTVIKSSILPAPSLFVPPPPELPKQRNQAGQQSVKASAPPLPPLVSQRASTTSIVSRQTSQSIAAGPFSVFDVSKELRDFRVEMEKEGIIKKNEFATIANNSEMETFLLKLVAWQAKKASSTPEQIEDARRRIIQGYDQIRSVSQRP